MSEAVSTSARKVSNSYYHDFPVRIASTSKMTTSDNGYQGAPMMSGGTANTGAPTVMTIGSRPTLIEVFPMRFLIMDAPRRSNLHLYIKEMKKHGVTEIVRVCEPTYSSGELSNTGMCLHEMAYDDGHAPSKEIIQTWLTLVEQTFFTTSKVMSQQEGAAKCIAVHCVAGLGRAPVMVAIALIEFANMDPVEAVTMIRRHRRGAINEKQLIYLEGYKRQYKKLKKRSGDADPQGSCCVVS